MLSYMLVSAVYKRNIMTCECNSEGERERGKKNTVKRFKRKKGLNALV